MITVALAKGALLKDSVARFAAAGLDFSAVLDKNNRQLMVPTPCGRARALLVRNGDVPTYVAYGQAQLGVVGYDVLKEHQLPVAQLVDLGFGGCRMAVAVQESSGYTRAADLPAHCRVASKFTHCAREYFDALDLPVELVHLNGSVELGPITGMSSTERRAATPESLMGSIHTAANPSSCAVWPPSRIPISASTMSAWLT